MSAEANAAGMIWTREKRLRTRSERGTLALAETIAEILRPPRLVILQGELGAGKTTLVKGWVQALGAGTPDDVTSPTFTLVHEYAGPRGNVFHLDLYRLEHERELDALGLEEMVSDAGATVLVEWGELFPAVVSMAGGLISITAGDADERNFHLQWRE